jgi:replicative DNA helicase Mcm
MAEVMEEGGIIGPAEGSDKRVDNPNSLSGFIDTQKLEIQENLEELRGGDTPKTLIVHLEDDIVGGISPGDKVTINGILKSHAKGKGNTKQTTFDIFLDCISFRADDKTISDIDISGVDEAKIKELAGRADIYDLITDAIAPTIFGMRTEKEAIALQLFGGVPKTSPSGTRLRGDIHILLVGDPGVAKSQLLSFVAGLAPRGIYASGKSVSAAGLTAAAVKSDELGDGRWTLEAGALVLADRGICCIDELDKMKDTDRDSLHTAIEQGFVAIHKAGINATLQTRCAVLAAANPELGRFDSFKNPLEQIALDPPLLTRFDVIFTITDLPDATQDKALAEHIITIHRTAKRDGIDTPQPLDKELLRKYISYAKRVIPQMSNEAAEQIKEHYVKVRKLAKYGAVGMTPRNVEAMIRLGEASARVRLCETIDRTDVDRAIRIIGHSLITSCVNESGQIDTDIIETGLSTCQRDRVHIILDIIEKSSGKDGIPLDMIMIIAEERGVPREKVQDDLDRLKRDGRIYEKHANQYKKT